MKRFLKFAAVIATVLMVCSSAWAYNFNDHVTQAPNNKGDALIFPWFLALDNGFQSKITVINTDTINSVVAKVVLRSAKNSQEVLDFLIYLSPADVWTAKIYIDTDNVVKIYSSDDSCIANDSLVFASKEVPMNESLADTSCPEDLNIFGYVNVILSAYGPVTNPAGNAAPGVLKSKIYGLYNPEGGTDTVTEPLVLPAVVDGLLVTQNSLAGFMEFADTVSGLTAGYRATALKNYGNLVKLQVQAESELGVGCNNTVGELEAALSKDNVAMPYINVDDIAIHLFTFPTKISNFKSCTAVTTSSPYFMQNAKSECVTLFDNKTFDLTEKYKSSPFSGKDSKKKLCWEANFVDAYNFVSFEEGWVNYVFNGAAAQIPVIAPTLDPASFVEYYGTPVLATYLYLGGHGMSGEYGAWTDTLVSDELGPLVNYQYTAYSN